MKVLIADDDQIVRKLLQALLSKLGHEVECATDGDEALRVLEQPEPPPLAILDWVMPGLTGLDVCKRLRAHHHRMRTYVVLLSSKADKDEIVAGLDAGADDYVIKPFHAMELLARLRVAHRTVNHQQQLQKIIDDLHALLEQSNIPAEILGNQGRGSNGLSEDVKQDAPIPRETTSILSPSRLNPALSRALTEFGALNVEVTTLAERPNPRDNSFTAWSSLVMLKEALWLDLIVEADQPSTNALFEALTGRVPVSEREQLDFLAETSNVLCTGIHKALRAVEVKLLTPFTSRSVRSSSIRFKLPKAAGHSHHLIALPGVTLALSVFYRHAPTCQKSLGQLKELDLVADNLPSASTTDVFLLNQGVILNCRYIEKLAALAQSTGNEIRVPIIEPSPLAEFFCLGRTPKLRS